MRAFVLGVSVAVAAGACGAQQSPTQQSGELEPGALVWSDSIHDISCPDGTALWTLNARNIARPADKPPRAVYQRGPNGKMYVLQCQPGYRCAVRPVAAWCQRPDGTEHGPYLEWYEDEREVRAVGGEFRDGQEHGRWTHWDRRGRVERVELYQRGRLVGTR